MIDFIVDNPGMLPITTGIPDGVTALVSVEGGIYVIHLGAWRPVMFIAPQSPMHWGGAPLSHSQQHHIDHEIATRTSAALPFGRLEPHEHEPRASRKDAVVEFFDPSERKEP